MIFLFAAAWAGCESLLKGNRRCAIVLVICCRHLDNEAAERISAASLPVGQVSYRVLVRGEVDIERDCEVDAVDGVGRNEGRAFEVLLGQVIEIGRQREHLVELLEDADVDDVVVER